MFDWFKKWKVGTSAQDEFEVFEPLEESVALADFASLGWQPRVFPGSSVGVYLPPLPTIKTVFGADGTLKGWRGICQPEFHATLHAHPNFSKDKYGALDFVKHLALVKQLPLHSLGDRCYFFDPTQKSPTQISLRFWNVAIPGAYVVVSFPSDFRGPRNKVWRTVWRYMPHIVRWVD